ncbi:hypothetical protein N431DRAFT_371699 [Stipitochalara longipes BDJ]|nr:hypothetical protein N431DRAFT_371699 [Stipitochalara longipes BDJ]
MSFRWSVGEVAECVKLLLKIRAAFKDPDGSAAEYQSAVDFLKGVETTVQGVEKILQDHPNLTFQADFQEHAANLMDAVAHFKTKTQGYDTSLGVNPTTSDAKKAWKKIKLALFGHIEELKSAVLYPQSIVNNLIDLQALDILIEVSEKPTISPQQLQDSTEEIVRNFPILATDIETLRLNIAEDFLEIQQTTQSNMQRNFDQIQEDLSHGNILQRSISAQVQADVETQDLWRSQTQIYFTEIRAEAQKHLEALQEMKRAQEINHQHSMQTALKVFSWKNAPRPVVKVIKKTVITNSRSTRSDPATKGGSSRGGSSQGGASKGGSSRGGHSHGESSNRGSSRGGNSQGGNSRGGDSQGGSSRGGSSNRGSSRGDNSQGGNTRGGDSQGGSSRGGSSNRGSSSGDKSQGGNSQGGSRGSNNIRRGSMRGSNAGGKSV